MLGAKSNQNFHSVSAITDIDVDNIVTYKYRLVIGDEPVVYKVSNKDFNLFQLRLAISFYVMN